MSDLTSEPGPVQSDLSQKRTEHRVASAGSHLQRYAPSPKGPPAWRRGRRRRSETQTLKKARPKSMKRTPQKRPRNQPETKWKRPNFGARNIRKHGRNKPNMSKQRFDISMPKSSVDDAHPPKSDWSSLQNLHESPFALRPPGL